MSHLCEVRLEEAGVSLTIREADHPIYCYELCLEDTSSMTRMKTIGSEDLTDLLRRQALLIQAFIEH